MATLKGTFADWLKGQGYTVDPSGAGSYSYLDPEGKNASLTGASESLSDMQRNYENQDYWRSVFNSLQTQPGGAGGFTPKSANIPSYQQWLASKGEGYQSPGTDTPEGEYVAQFYNIPDYSKGDWLEQFASNLPKIMAGGILSATAGPALMDFAGVGGAGGGGPGIAGAADEAINLSDLATQTYDLDPSDWTRLTDAVDVGGSTPPYSGGVTAADLADPTAGIGDTSALGPGSTTGSNSILDFLGKVSPGTWVNAGANLLGAGVGAYGANRAAGIQSDAANQANNTILQMYNQNRADLAPWRKVGGAAITRAGGIMEPGGGQKLLEMDPGYAFRLAEGNKAIDRAAAARGMYDSGPTLKSLTRYGQDYASGEFGNAYNRLLALAGMGQTATGQTGQLGQNAATQIAGGQNLAGAANASGYVGMSNALTGGLSGFLRNYQEQALLDQILGARRV